MAVPRARLPLQRRKVQFEAGREVRIVGQDTDLRLGTAGRTWVTDDGKHNMPGGEIFTGPIEDSVEGEISYDFPAVYAGHEVDGVRLRFQAGKVVDASARAGAWWRCETRARCAGTGWCTTRRSRTSRSIRRTEPSRWPAACSPRRRPPTCP